MLQNAPAATVGFSGVQQRPQQQFQPPQPLSNILNLPPTATPPPSSSSFKSGLATPNPRKTPPKTPNERSGEPSAARTTTTASSSSSSAAVNTTGTLRRTVNSSGGSYSNMSTLCAADEGELLCDTEVGVEVEEGLALDDRNLPLAFHAPRHREEIVGGELESQSWRMREKMKTVSVALVICLNVGVDPPDVTKTQPCARMECWIDPATLNPARALEAIGNNLQKQYDRWQSRARYRQSLDPTVDEVRRLATGLRRNARDERVLFHYNGHGVPKPTANGEIWVFNRTYTQYIPLSVYDLQTWMGSPSIFVYDCSNAGIIVSCFEQFAEQHDQVNQSKSTEAGGHLGSSVPSMRNCIQLAACSATQLLPMNPELPADLFTSCLTTPIKMALRWFVMQNQGKLAPQITVEMLDKIPGQFGDRRTMLGELNWIFTAITDTIAWNTLPRSLFQRLFRQDLLVASLFRNFLLAERVMRSYDCTPVSQPALPNTHQHPMWKAWDLAVDVSLSQLQGILERGNTYQASSFFEEQLTAFEVWLRHGNEFRPPPEQLPIVLQVLLSQAHRLRALDLLGRFLDLGPWAVNLALSVGIFPYVLKLLQSAARELRPLLVSIWSKILAVDPSCQTDLVRDGSHKYFLHVLQDDCMMPDHRTWAAFILASVVNGYRQGQQEAEQGNLISIALEQLDSQDGPLLRQWLAIALGRVWDRYEQARWRGVRNNAHEKLYELLQDPVPEVRAAAVFALGTFVNSCEERSEHANSLDHSVALHLLNTVACDEGSPLVRQELVVALHYIVLNFESNFISIRRQQLLLEEEQLQRQHHDQQHHTITAASSQGYFKPSASPGLFLGGTPVGGGHRGGGGAITKASSSAAFVAAAASAAALNPSASSSALDRLYGHQGIRNSRSSSNLSAVAAAAAAASSSLISGSSTSLSSMSPSTLMSGGVYAKVWNGLQQLAVDPHPDVSSMAQQVTSYINRRVMLQSSNNSVGGGHLRSSTSGSGNKSLYYQKSPAMILKPTLETLSVPSSPSSKALLQSPSNSAKPIFADSDNGGSSQSQQQQQQQQQSRFSVSAASTAKNEALSSEGGAVPVVLGAGASGSTLPLINQAIPPEGGAADQSQQQSSAAAGSNPLLTSPELTTEFVAWSSRFFSKQLMKHECLDCDCDYESDRHWKKEWEYNRNHNVRLEAERQLDWVKRGSLKLDVPGSKVPGGAFMRMSGSLSSNSAVATSSSATSIAAATAAAGPTTAAVISTTTAIPAEVMAFHPYNPKIVVAGGDQLGMWDFENGVLLSSPQLQRASNAEESSTTSSLWSTMHDSHITSLDYINAHEDALLLVACDDGTVRLFKDCGADDEAAYHWATVAALNTSVSALSGLSGSGSSNNVMMGGGATTSTKFTSSRGGTIKGSKIFYDQNPTTHRLVSAWSCSYVTKDLARMRGGVQPPSSDYHVVFQRSRPVRTAWSQLDLTLAVGGGGVGGDESSRYIRLWDARSELKKADLATGVSLGSSTYLTALTFSSYYAACSSSAAVFVAGFSDGAVRLFDARCHHQDACVATFNDFRGPIMDCRLQDQDGAQLVLAGCANGTVRAFEPRKSFRSSPETSLPYDTYSSPSSSSQGFSRSSNAAAGPVVGFVDLGHPVSSLAIHQRAPVFAAWVPFNQQVVVNCFRHGQARPTTAMDNNTPTQPSHTVFKGALMNSIKYHDDGVLGQKLGPQGTMVFHPLLIQLAIGSKDSGAVSIRKIRNCT